MRALAIILFLSSLQSKVWAGKFYPLDPVETPAPVKPLPKPVVVEIAEKIEEAPKPQTLDDFQGVTVTGVPRLIRDNPVTEVFFRDLNTSYVIHQDSRHNRFFSAFENASKTNRSVSFRVDPVSRRVLAMDGVDGVTKPVKAGSK